MSAGVARDRAVDPRPPIAGASAPGAPVRVLKFGSSVLADAGRFGPVADALRAHAAEARKTVAVVSAMGDATDRLTRMARAVAPVPPAAQLCALLATGEEASVALLTMALAVRGVAATGFTAQSLPVRTRGALEDADPVHVDVDRIVRALAAHDVVVLPGFVGVDATGAPSVLGRGGSDLSALFLGHALRAAEVRLVKDVDGIYERDPGREAGLAPLARLSWSEARRIGGGVVQDKALRFAARHGLAFRVASLGGGRGTWVGPAGPALA